MGIPCARSAIVHPVLVVHGGCARLCTGEHEWPISGLLIPVLPALLSQVIARQIGTAVEEVIGTGEVDLIDLVAGLTRVIFINMNTGGCVNLRLKALDFGLPAGGVQEVPQVTTTVCPDLACLTVAWHSCSSD